MSLDILLQSLPPAQRKHLDPAGPKPARMMAAKGLVPLPPREMVIVLSGLALDADEKLAQSALQSLEKLPDKLVAPVLSGDLPVPTLAVLTKAFVSREALLEQLVLNRTTPDDALAFISPSVSAHIIEIMAGNQERCMRSEALVRGISTNPNVLKSSLDRLFDFLVRAGVIYGDMPQFGDAVARLSVKDIEQVSKNVPLPPEVAELVGGDLDDEEVLDDDQATERVPLVKLIAGLSVEQRVALALRGNKSARTILLRDSNRVVATAAIRSPRVTEQEIVAAAQSRSINEEVIRVICHSKEMTRPYGVKMALVNNPKTPLPVAMRYLPLLRGTDLKAVSKSKNVSSALANQARRLIEAKRGKK